MTRSEHPTIGQVEVDQWTAPGADHDMGAPDGDAWDLLIIGGGTAGIVAAKTAAGFGASVLLVERHRTGGDCLWTGCVPSKALLAAAHAAADARAAARLGVHVDGVRVDFTQVMAHVRRAITTIEPEDAPSALRAAGARVVHGTARLSGAGTAVVDGATVTFRQALLATGSAPSMPDIPGLAAADPWTSDTIWQLDHLPDRLLVLGGGSIGCELGQAFARLGSKVTIVESAATILAREDQQAAALLRAAFAEDDITVHTGSTVTAVDRDPSGTRTVTTSTGVRGRGRDPGRGRAPPADRRPRASNWPASDLDERGYVVVNDRLQTSNPRIWAAGDLTGYPQFTHTAGVHASTAAEQRDPRAAPQRRHRDHPPRHLHPARDRRLRRQPAAGRRRRAHRARHRPRARRSRHRRGAHRRDHPAGPGPAGPDRRGVHRRSPRRRVARRARARGPARAARRGIWPPRCTPTRRTATGRGRPPSRRCRTGWPVRCSHAPPEFSARSVDGASPADPRAPSRRSACRRRRPGCRLRRRDTTTPTTVSSSRAPTAARKGSEPGWLP